MPIDPARTVVILRRVSEAICTAEGWRDIQALQDQITEAVADLSCSDEPDELGRLRETLAEHYPTDNNTCFIPPEGWTCTRAPGHDGPCAATEIEPLDLRAQLMLEIAYCRHADLPVSLIVGRIMNLVRKDTAHV